MSESRRTGLPGGVRVNRARSTQAAHRRPEIDPYEVLQVSRGASTDVIRAAYRVLARSYHPDINSSPVAALHMQEINAAYTLLIDPERRAQYDASQPMRWAQAATSRRTASPLTCQSQVEPPPPLVPVGRRRSRSTLFVVATGLLLTLAVVVVFLAGVSLVLDAFDGPVAIQPVEHTIEMPGSPG